ncbi:MAG: hypothetical protein ACTH7W_10505 [Psychrobacter sp.]|uniref:hypothetical protein n=1 Tax=unclassified Psychrobacter TaxID=196806 RepID=UPI001787B9B2|nr:MULTISPECIES: hypothetical protein [unclassified Psychrobacter]MBE0443393.1 hypothetical protein [Psychrobacter sp. FME13]
MSDKANEVKKFSLEEITKLLIKESHITEGYYLALIVPTINGGQFKSKDGDGSKQGIIIEFDSVRLLKVDEHTESAVSAADM